MRTSIAPMPTEPGKGRIHSGGRTSPAFHAMRPCARAFTLVEMIVVMSFLAFFVLLELRNSRVFLGLGKGLIIAAHELRESLHRLASRQLVGAAAEQKHRQHRNDAIN